MGITEVFGFFIFAAIYFIVRLIVQFIQEAKAEQDYKRKRFIETGEWSNKTFDQELAEFDRERQKSRLAHDAELERKYGKK